MLISLRCFIPDISIPSLLRESNILLFAALILVLYSAIFIIVKGLCCVRKRLVRRSERESTPYPLVQEIDSLTDMP